MVPFQRIITQKLSECFMLKKILLSCFAIFGLAFVFSFDTYADTVQSYTYDISYPQASDFYIYKSDNTNPYNFTPKYFKLVVENSNTSGTNYTFRFFRGSSYCFAVQLPLNSNSYTYPLTFNSDWTVCSYSNSDVYIPSADIRENFTYKVTLYSDVPTVLIPEGSISITSNGTYDVTNYATAVVDVSTTNTWVVELFKDGFWGIMTALVALIVPVLVLFLVFRLVHDWLWGKG